MHYKIRPVKTQSTWMLSFIDLVTLMLTFFVLIFATQKPNDLAWQQTQQSFQTTFKGVGGQITDNKPQKIDDNDDIVKQLTDDTHAGLDIEYLTGLLNKAFAQDLQLAQMPFQIIAQPLATHLRLPLSAWQDLAMVTRRAQILAPLLNRLDNQVAIVAYTPQTAHGLVQAQIIADILQKSGYEKNIRSTAQLTEQNDFIDVVLTFNAP